MSDIYFLRKLWLTPNFGHALIPTLRLSLPFFLEKESESIKESNTFLQKVKVNASATLWFAEKESNFFGLRRDRTKKLQTAHIMDVSLTQFWRMLKGGWNADWWAGNHLSPSWCIFGFVFSFLCTFGETSYFYVHFEVLPPTIETVALSKNTFSSRLFASSFLNMRLIQCAESACFEL